MDEGTKPPQSAGGRIGKYRKTIPALKGSDLFFLLFFSVVAGLGSGSGAILFRWLLDASNRFFFQGAGTVLRLFGPAHVILLPALGGAVVGPLIHFFSRESKGTGVPEIMLSVATFRSVIPPRVVFMKILVSAICIGSGGSAGREGPIVQSGSAVGSYLGARFRLSEERRKILLACGAAGGVAATFNAPLGGIFFALEIILGEYGPRYFSAVVLSSMTATELSRYFLGDNPAFRIPAYRLGSPWQLPLYLLLGGLAALAATLFVRSIYRCEDLFDGLRIPPYAKPALGGLAVGLIGFAVPGTFGVGYEQIERLFDGRTAADAAFVLLFAKMAATSATLGSGGSGGIFAPCLFLGAMFGSLFGHAMTVLLPGPGIAAGAGALVGMGALFAGAAHAPITSILLVYEMTGDYQILLPLMIACVTATFVAGRLQPDSIYTLKLLRRGIDIVAIRGLNLLETLPVSESMTTPVVTVGENASLSAVEDLMNRTGRGGLPVLDKNGRLSGMVARADIGETAARGKGEIFVREAMRRDVVTCFADEHLGDAMQKMGENDIGQLPVVERSDPSRPVGMITRRSVIDAYGEVSRKRKEARNRGID